MLRIVSGRSDLLGRIARRARRRQASGLAERYEDRAHALEENAAVIRDAIARFDGTEELHDEAIEAARESS
jgi:hypothetical protein